MLAGIRIAVVVGVGLATIAAAIGAGGLGVLIYRGVATVDHRLILAGAVPAAAAGARLRLRPRRSSRSAWGRTSGEARRRAAAAARCSCWRAPAAEAASGPIRVGSKNFTEQVILGEIAAQALEARGR